MGKENKRDIRSLSIEELEKFFIQNGDQPFRAIQVYQWLWKKGVHDFDFMTNLSKSTRKLLKKYFVINHIAIHRQQKSKDGTVKNLIKLFDNLMVESVLIRFMLSWMMCFVTMQGQVVEERHISSEEWSRNCTERQIRIRRCRSRPSS